MMTIEKEQIHVGLILYKDLKLNLEKPLLQKSKFMLLIYNFLDLFFGPTCN